MIEHRPLLWGLAYRMTGVAADADDIVQETFARALKAKPKDDRPLRPWLVKVTLNLARDALRRRRRIKYVGPWLPAPVEDEALDIPDVTPSASARYELKESASAAFLLALEKLTPLRRAVLILRDVFDYSGEETARALGISVDNVKQTLLRARRDMAGYDGGREPLDVKSDRDKRALSRFMMALASGDVDAIEELLADDVVALADGGGVYAAAKVPVRGARKVASVYRNLVRVGGIAKRVDLVMLNGQPALVADLHPGLASAAAPRVVITVDTDARGRIIAVRSVMAPGKLTYIH